MTDKPQHLQPHMIYDMASCYRKALEKTLRITAQPILLPLHETAHALVADPNADQDHCKEVLLAVLHRRNTKMGVAEREEWHGLEHHEKDEWLKQKKLHHIVKKTA